MKLNHPVKDFLSPTEVDLLFLLNDGSILQKFNTFCSRLETLALSKYGGENDEDDRNKFKGDLFELFVEYLIKCKGMDSRIAICDYQTTDEAGFCDWGVDGIGKSTINSKMAAVQVKYRQENKTLTWNEGNFGNFGFQSLQLIMKVAGSEHFPADNTQLLYITSAGSVHYTTDEIGYNQIRVIDRMGLRELCDNQTEFWNQFRESILSSKTKVGSITPKLILRQHQIEAVREIITDIMNKDGKGRIVLPTGTGKTLIQAETIIEANRTCGFASFAVLSPRILLSFQHLVKISDHLISNGIDAEYLNVNSGHFDEQIINQERVRLGQPASRVHSTTSSEEIKRIYRRAQEQNKILVISSTYHSAGRIEVPIDLQLNDEAHNMVSEEFTGCHGIGRCCFHFTATERHTDSDDGLGMNNEVLWGNTIFEKLPKEMIAAGEMLPPILHIVETSQGRIADNDYNSIFSAIGESFFYHRQRLYKISADHNKIGAKLLISVNGQRTLRGILGSGQNGVPGCITFENFRKANPNIFIFSISSDLGAYLNGQWLPTSSQAKDQLLQQVRHLPDNAEAIVLYVDMLTEGIDVPGITAFMPFRGMGASTFTQGIGRATRLYNQDRSKFYNGEIGTAETDATAYVKPCAEVIITDVLVNSTDTAAQYARLWRSLYGTFGEREHVVFSSYRGVGCESSLTDLSNVDRQFSTSDSGIDTFLHRIVGRPDRLDIDKLWFVAAIRAGCSEALIRQLHRKMGFAAHLDMYKSIANWQERDGTKISDLVQQMRNSGQSVFADEVKKKFGTIYTPEFVVEKTVDLAWKYIPTDQDKLQLTYCDPAAGDGNFLDYVHQKLMLETSISDPVQRSFHILTKCLYGFEILEPMVHACKIRLMLLHKKVLDEHGKTDEHLLDLIDKLHIYHGNTICQPADTEQEWYQNRTKDEGGLLPEELREKKFDVIIGNPPYTHLRNLGNRRYAAYPKQRDLAQVFVRWGLDHLSEAGVVSFNTIDTWLNVKTSDGALETRMLVRGRLREIAQDETIMRYSEAQNDGGGEIPTCLVCFSSSSTLTITFDGTSYSYTDDELTMPGFLNSLRFGSLEYPFCYKPVYDYLHTLRGVRSSNRHNSTNPAVRFVFRDLGNGDDYYLVSKEGIYEHTYKDNWRVVRGSEITTTLSEMLTGEIKFAKANSREHAMWLLGYFTTDCAKSYVLTYCKVAPNHGGWMAVLAARRFAACRVPDFDFYRQDRPERFQAYMDWIEANMRDKDAFLAGIDEQFEKLIA